MTVNSNYIRACRNCGAVYSEISRSNYMKCPVCGHKEGEDIEGIHY